ncbi:MAG: hypothetical protein ACM3RP_07125 [Chitinophagales bacterium]
MNNLSDLFPEGVPVKLDRERSLNLCIAGWRFLEDVYGGLDEVLAAAQRMGQSEQVGTDLLLFVRACLMDAEGRSPLTVPELESLSSGANLNEWRTAVLEAVTNFFPTSKAEKKGGSPWSWEWAAWFVMGVCGRSEVEFMGMTIRKISALAQGRAKDFGIENNEQSEPKSKGRPITMADFGPDGQFRPRKDGEQ